ncbi:helix-turn-helix domain-containing protein [Lactiplantibacillus plantarum]|uniref:helix-turn-helix domain-containing protein n=1 Tax=Lactiplantibacillus plantarum TaxID=1590 RepID=UPI0005EDEF7A|nr:helix-turn-helix transcriptional regulator [Lactiplantibacillus plantarum]AMO29233.1 Cro/Cl family transcriptional regulator [Lactiplantibacillus plantarum]AZU39801.1 transcriptional regulator [Lactiplantibacillus plantarum]KZU98430.1 Rad protein [Lactiplantibacillus plantarum]MBO3685367.1 helix-turn-helix transcriptional regulator [Lactiplantibacillus plantarum]MCT0497245.1 XRE family transcriptional regulator [Lactiplantibacillus plantarum]
MAFLKIDNGELLKNIRQFSKKNGLTLAEVATLAGLSASAIYSWKKHTPSVGTLKEVAQVLGTSYTKLVGKDKEPTAKATNTAAVDLKKVIENKKNQFEYDGQPITNEQMKIIRNVLKSMFKTPRL